MLIDMDGNGSLVRGIVSCGSLYKEHRHPSIPEIDWRLFRKQPVVRDEAAAISHTTGPRSWWNACSTQANVGPSHTEPASVRQISCSAEALDMSHLHSGIYHQPCSQATREVKTMLHRLRHVVRNGRPAEQI